MAKCTHFQFYHEALLTTYDDGAAKTVAADVLAIPLTHPVVAKTTGADAEALTLADGTYPGQTVTVYLATDGGGDGTITPTTATNWATVVLADAGDQVTFGWVDTTVGWMIVETSGVAGPPVKTV
jgi:hypothetical protein